LRLSQDGWALEQYHNSKGKLPAWFLNEPETVPGDEFYIKAFFHLSSTRDFGFSMGPIPWTAILRYGEYYGLDRLRMDAFFRIIRSLDEFYTEHLKEEQKKRRESTDAVQHRRNRESEDGSSRYEGR
jgi:hypothetical protein